MLILTRKSGESINIGSDIVVRVLEIKGGQARIGIEAPRDIAVHREEVYRQVQKRNEMAAKRSPDTLSALQKLWAEKGGKSPVKPAIRPGSEQE